MHPKATPEDPQAKLARQAEQQRADAAYTTDTQSLIDQEMRTRQRRFGSRMAMTGAGAGAMGGTGPSMGGGYGGGGSPFTSGGQIGLAPR